MSDLSADIASGTDIPTVAWVKVEDAIKMLWVDNPKRHDIGSVIQSIERYGFQELPKFDKLLRNSTGEQGAIKAGNGRVEALYKMERDGHYELPRGLAKTKDGGQWVLPVIIGVDAETETQAIAYAIDSNNLTMLGGDFNIYDIMHMYDETKYMEILQNLATDGTAPVTVSAEDIDTLLRASTFREELEDLSDEDVEEKAGKKTITLIINNVVCLEEAISAIRELVDDNPNWNASIKV